MADAGTGIVPNGAGVDRRRRRKGPGRRAAGPVGPEARLAEERARLDAITGALDTTASEIDGLIAAAEQARDVGAAPQQLQSIRRMIELMGGQLGVPAPGVPQPQGSRPVPGSEALIRSGLNRFDAIFDRRAAAAQAQSRLGQLGVQPEAAVALRALSAKILQGIPLNEPELAAYAQAFSEVTRARVVGDGNGRTRLVQPRLDPALFPPPQAIGAPAADTPSPQSTAAAPVEPAASGGLQNQIARTPGNRPQGTPVARGVREAILNPDGSVNRELVFSLASGIPLLRPGQKTGDPKTLQDQIAEDLGRKLERETGAAPSEAELQRVVNRFVPAPLASDGEVRERLDRLVRFSGANLRRSDRQLFETLIARAREQGNAPNPPENEGKAEFRGFDPASGGAIFRRPDNSFFGVPRNG